MPDEIKFEDKANPAQTTTDNAAKVTTPLAGTGGGEVAKSEAGKSATADPQIVTIGDDDYPVDKDGYLRISVQTFKRRLGRYSKVQLKEFFGTDNVEDIKARLDEHGKLKEKSDAEHRKTLAKEEQLQQERDKERKRADDAEARATKLAEEREYNQADQEVRAAAEEFVKPGKLAKLAAYEFGEYVRDLDEDEAASITKSDVKKWFRQYAIDNPEFAKGAGPAKSEEAGDDKAKERKPLSHGAGEQGGAPTPAPAVGGKTARPGQPGSMTDAEYRAFKRQQGINA